jgi:hypothetical protein
MLCFETPDYGDRAWCRLERAVAFAFMFSGVCCSPPAATNLAHAVCASCTRRVFLLHAHCSLTSICPCEITVAMCFAMSFACVYFLSLTSGVAHNTKTHSVFLERLFFALAV